MYKIRLNYDVPHWAYYRRCKAIQRNAPDDFDVDIGAWHGMANRDVWLKKYDLILQLVPDHQNLRTFLNRMGHRDTVIVGGLNVGWGHHVERLRMCSTGVSHIVVNNRDCYERLERPENLTWISNGVDFRQFHITTPIEDRKPRVLWTGSHYHCHRTNIKGYREVLVPLRRMLDDAGIDFSFRKVQSELPHKCHSADNMAQWYNTGTIYLCASSSEGTPNPALEAAASGCTVVTTKVGNMLELIVDDVNGYFCERSPDAFFNTIQKAIANYQRLAANMQADILDWDWDLRAIQYYDLFRRLINERRAS
jgi:glycosyltransferase involved in cell wall biosynthesis